MSIYRYREYMASNSAYEDYSVVANSYDKYRVAFGIERILGALGKYSERNPVSSLSILEAGCGTGNFTLEMCRYVAHVTAVDGSDDMLAVAESKLKGVKNVSFKNVDLRKELSFESNQFDGVLLIYVAHHLDQGCSNVFNSGPNFTFAYIYWAITKKATSGSACCETRMWLADRGEQS